MKRYQLYIILVSLVTIFFACTKEEEVQIASLDIENVAIKPSYTSAQVQCNVIGSATINEVLLQYTTDSAFGEYKEASMVKVEKTENRYNVSIDSLVLMAAMRVGAWVHALRNSSSTTCALPVECASDVIRQKNPS